MNQAGSKLKRALPPVPRLWAAIKQAEHSSGQVKGGAGRLPLNAPVARSSLPEDHQTKATFALCLLRPSPPSLVLPEPAYNPRACLILAFLSAFITQGKKKGFFHTKGSLPFSASSFLAFWRSMDRSTNEARAIVEPSPNDRSFAARKAIVAYLWAQPGRRPKGGQNGSFLRPERTPFRPSRSHCRRRSFSVPRGNARRISDTAAHYGGSVLVGSGWSRPLWLSGKAPVNVCLLFATENRVCSGL